MKIQHEAGHFRTSPTYFDSLQRFGLDRASPQTKEFVLLFNRFCQRFICTILHMLLHLKSMTMTLEIIDQKTCSQTSHVHVQCEFILKRSENCAMMSSRAPGNSAFVCFLFSVACQLESSLFLSSDALSKGFSTNF